MPQLSIWEKESFFAPQDVIIIGSGFVGLWSALHIKFLNPDYKITVVERGLIPTGASTRNAGFSCFGSPSEIISDAATMGEDNMWQLVEMRYRGLMEIQKYFTHDEIGYDPSGGYECFANASADWEDSSEKLSWLNNGMQKITGIANVFTVQDEKIASMGFGFNHLIENKLEGGLHSGKLIQTLLKKVQGLGVQVLTGMDIKNYEKINNDIVLQTTADITLQAKQLLLCTNAFTKQLIPDIDIIPNRGQVLVTNPIPNLKIKGTFHFDKGYYYFRNVGNRLLLGGARNKDFERENTTEMLTTETIQQELENFMRQYLLPNTSFTITDRWSGIMAMGKEKLPIVQSISDNVFCCVRMSGMGVALAPVVAQKVAQLMKNH
jgi:glycine/D-amino acid oxidase-like deaminating enzyme